MNENLKSKIEELVNKIRLTDSYNERQELIDSTNLGNNGINKVIKSYFLGNFMYLDGELLKNIEEHRGGPQCKGSIDPDWDEINLLMEAYKSPQYNRFMYHIMNAYSGVDEYHQIYPIQDDHVFDCCICWKKTMGSIMHNRWYGPENNNGIDIDSNKEHLAFTSTSGTKTTICLDCLVQLRIFKELLELIKN